MFICSYVAWRELYIAGMALKDFPTNDHLIALCLTALSWTQMMQWSVSEQLVINELQKV
jgi:hypothetical protein